MSTKESNFRKWRKTRIGFLVLGFIELAISYALVSFAIYSGNIIAWMATIVFFVQAVKNFVKLIGSLAHGKRQTS